MLKPIGGRVIVEQEVERLSTALILDLEDDLKLPKGVIVAVGDCDLKIGDKVYFNEIVGSRIKHDGKEYLILKLQDILAVYD